MSDRLHVILITIDSLRADIIYNQKKWNIKLDFINKLMKESLVYKNHFSVGPNTPYSFPGLLASIYPTMYEAKIGLVNKGLHLAEYLKKANSNIVTQALISNNVWLDYKFGYHRGFDNFYFFEKNKHPRKSSKQSWIKLLNSTVFSKGKRMAHFLLRRKPFPRFEELLDFFFKNNKLKNFAKTFTWFHLMDLHLPYIPKNIYVNPFLSYKLWRFQIGTLPYPLSHNLLSVMKLLYSEELKYLDRQLGRLVAYLENERLYDEVVLVITSDHGEEFWEQNGLNHTDKLIDELLHVPLIIKLPIKFNKRGEVDNITSHIDLPPTIAEFFGFKKPPQWEGTSLLEDRRNCYAISEVISKFKNSEEKLHDQFAKRVSFDGKGIYKISIKSQSGRISCYVNKDKLYIFHNSVDSLNLQKKMLSRLKLHYQMVSRSRLIFRVKKYVDEKSN